MGHIITGIFLLGISFSHATAAKCFVEEETPLSHIFQPSIAPLDWKVGQQTSNQLVLTGSTGSHAEFRIDQTVSSEEAVGFWLNAIIVGISGKDKYEILYIKKRVKF